MVSNMRLRRFCALAKAQGECGTIRPWHQERVGQHPSGEVGGGRRGARPGGWCAPLGVAAAVCVGVAPLCAGSEDIGATGATPCTTIIANQTPSLRGAQLITSWDPDGPGPQRALLVVVDTVILQPPPVFTSATPTGVWTFDGVAWRRFDTGVPGVASAVGTFQNRLIIAGSFDDPSAPVGGAPLSLLSFDGVRWSRLPGGFTPARGGTITAIQEFNGQLFVAGTFSAVDGSPAMNIARFDGTTWQPAGAGFDLSVNALAVVTAGDPGPRLYAAGSFLNSGSTLVNRVAEWNGAAWRPLGAGFDRRAWAVAEYQGQLVALHESNGVQTSGWSQVSRFNGQTWMPLGGPVNPGTPQSRSIVVAGGTMYQQAQVGTAAGFAAFDGTAWQSAALSTGFSTAVRMTRVDAIPIMSAGSTLYWLTPTSGHIFQRTNSSTTFVYDVRSVGGQIFAMGAVGRLFATSTEANVNVYEGFAWRDLPGLTGTVVDAVQFDGQPTVVGQLSTIGTSGSGVVAAWNGSAWADLGLRGSQATSAAVVDGTLYVSGANLLATTPPGASNIVCKVGSDWRRLPDPGPPFSPLTLANYRGRLIVYGNFIGAQGGPNHIAEWAGAGWRSLSSLGLPSAVLAAAIDADTLYVATGSGVFRLDGTTWTSLGQTPTAPNNLAVIDGRVLVSSGSTLFERIGTQWTMLRFDFGSFFEFAQGSLRTINGQLWATDAYIAAYRPIRFDLDTSSTITYETLDAPVGFRPSSRVLAVAVSGPTPTAAVWRRNGTPLAAGGTLPGGTVYFGGDTLRLTLNSLRPADAGDFDCVVTAPCGTLTSRIWHIDAPCPSDINRDGFVTVNDLFTFVTAYFAGSAAANFNGVGGITPQDIFEYVAAFLSGC